MQFAAINNDTLRKTDRVVSGKTTPRSVFRWPLISGPMDALTVIHMYHCFIANIYSNNLWQRKNIKNLAEVNLKKNEIIYILSILVIFYTLSLPFGSQS